MYSICYKIGLLGLVLIALGCSTPTDDPNENQNVNQNENDNSNPAGLTVIDSGVEAHIESQIRTSDSHIVFRSNSTDGFVTRVFDTASQQVFDVLGNGLGAPNDFAISGTTVILAGEDRLIYEFDTSNPENNATAVSGFVVLHPNSSMQTDGENIIAFITDEGFTAICWVDLRDASLFIRTFGELPSVEFSQLSVDGTQIAFVDDDVIKVRDTANPGDSSTSYSVNIDNSVQIDFKDGYITYVELGGQVMVLDTSDGSTIETGVTYGAGNIATRNGVVCMFNDDFSFASTWASSVFTIDSSSLDTAPDLDRGFASPGWGQSCALSTDGSTVFVGGIDEPDNLVNDVLAVWMDAEVSDVFSGSANEDGLVAGSNVTSSDNLAAFLLHQGAQEATIGYVDF